MPVEIRETPLLTEARCTACLAELAVYSDDARLVRRELARFERKHNGGNHEKRSHRDA